MYLSSTEPFRDPPPRPPRGFQTHGWIVTLALIVENDDSASLAFQRMLDSIAREILVAKNAAQARTLARARQPQLILLDIRLEDGDGLELLAHLRSIGVIARVVVVSGFVDDDVEVRARKLGVLAVLRKPISLAALLAATQNAMQTPGPLGEDWAEEIEGTWMERWVSVVLQALESPRDPHVREELGRRGSVSVSTLKRICAGVSVEPHDTRDLARMLNGLIWSRRLGVPVESLLRAGDDRTIERLLARSGVDRRTAQATIREFLDRQQFVPPDNFAFRRLRQALLGESCADGGGSGKSAS